MCEHLDQALADGRGAAKHVVEHVLDMGAAAARIPIEVEVGDKLVEFIVTCVRNEPNRPRRSRWPVMAHPNGSGATFCYGTYFPGTDLCVTDMGMRRTGAPEYPSMEWLD